MKEYTVSRKISSIFGVTCNFLGDDNSPEDDPLPGNDVSASPFKNNNTTNNNVSPVTTISSPAVSVNVTHDNGDHMPSTTEDNTGNADENDATQDNKTTRIFNYVKIGILLCVWGLFTGFLMTTNEKVIDRKQIAIPAQMPKGKYILFPKKINKHFTFHPRSKLSSSDITLEHRPESTELAVNLRYDYFKSVKSESNEIVEI